MDTSVLTVVFTDLVGSVRMFSQFSDAVAVDLVRTLDRQVQDALPAFRGTFIKSTGDGQLLTFEEPSAAARCAAEIHRLCEGVARTQRLDLFVRVALHCGEVFHGDGDIHGNTVNLAARLLAIAGPCETCVSDATWSSLQAPDRSGYIPHGPEVFKGFSRYTLVHKKTNANAALEATFRQRTMIDADAPQVAAQHTPRHPAYVLALDHPEVKKTIVLCDGETHTIGRAPECSTVIPDRTFSGTHAAFAVVDGVTWAFDLQSANGLVVKGRRINRRRPLDVGSRVDLPTGTVDVKLP
jgi:class 3 adenylate cyclase